MMNVRKHLKPAGAVRPLRDNDVAVDELSVRGAVIGDGLMLRRDGREAVTIHTVEGGRARLLGSFPTAAEAWRALDDLDAPDAGLEEAA